jgi:hypothetical protein
MLSREIYRRWTKRGHYCFRSIPGVISTADGLPFYIGWRWTNDDNTGSQFSFAIDNVVISATPPGIETEAYVRGTEKSIKSSTVRTAMLFIF